MTSPLAVHEELRRIPRAEVVVSDVSAETLEQALATGLVAVDIETTGLDPRRDEVGTCQIFIQPNVVKIVRPGSSAPCLQAILEHPRILKIFHHAPFDTSFLLSRLGIRVNNIACTKIASKILDPMAIDHSLKTLLRRHLGIVVEKNPGVRTSDWSAAGLSDMQIKYAAEDVVFLPALMESLSVKLDQAGRRELAEASFRFVPKHVELKLLGLDNVFEY